MRALFALVASVALWGCGDPLFPSGHTCRSSSECESGLLCDYGPTPHVCAGMSTASSDLAAATADDAGMDVMSTDQGVADLPPPPLDLPAMQPDLAPSDL